MLGKNQIMCDHASVHLVYCVALLAPRLRLVQWL
jgi:hypothetical protein